MKALLEKMMEQEQKPVWEGSDSAKIANELGLTKEDIEKVTEVIFTSVADNETTLQAAKHIMDYLKDQKSSSFTQFAFVALLCGFMKDEGVQMIIALQKLKRLKGSFPGGL